ncbi:hypothetical protein RNC47_29445, partial [Streptomyces sp. DSM 44918]|nr:hypothetical protein [Streptomyces sp. DSM 44918]
MNLAQRTRLAGAGVAVLLAAAGTAGTAAPAAAAEPAAARSFHHCPPDHPEGGAGARHGICLCVWLPLPPWWPPGCPTPPPEPPPTPTPSP